MTASIQRIVPDPVDRRDFIFRTTFGKLPTNVDLRCYAEDIEDQKMTGSCVANSTVSALELLLERNDRFFDLSRLFLYYNLRKPYAELHNVDEGSYLRDGFKSVSNLGICSEDVWGFDVSKVNAVPDYRSYTEALQHKVQKYERIPNTSMVLSTKAAIAKGYPVTIGLFLGQSFYNIYGHLHTHDYNGVDNDNVGGHAMVVVGYDDSLGGFIVENSWSKLWGDEGYFLLKYHVMEKDCQDAWVCTAFDDMVFEDLWPIPEPEPEPEPEPDTPEPEPEVSLSKIIEQLFEIFCTVLKKLKGLF